MAPIVLSLPSSSISSINFATCSPSSISNSNSKIIWIQTLSTSSPRRQTQIRASASSPMAFSSEGSGGGFMDFPYSSPPVRDLMVELVSTVEARLQSQLLPSTLPPDVNRFQNESGSSHASLHICSGVASSSIDFILGSWLHCQLPTGASLNISSLSCYLNELTDAPHFLIELIQSSPTSLVLVLDLPPRKDLVLHPDYLKTFYEDTELDKHRQLLEKIHEVQPYVSSSLYIRCALSPTAILVRIGTEAGGERCLEEIVRDNVSLMAKEVLDTWLGGFMHPKREFQEAERVNLRKRDQMFKSKTIEIDLGSNLPRLFGQETAARVLEALKGELSI